MPERHVLVFHLKDGTAAGRRWSSTAKRDMWTPERKAIWGRYLREGGNKGTVLGFNDHAAREGQNCERKERPQDTGHQEPLHRSPVRVNVFFPFDQRIRTACTNTLSPIRPMHPHRFRLSRPLLPVVLAKGRALQPVGPLVLFTSVQWGGTDGPLPR